MHEGDDSADTSHGPEEFFLSGNVGENETWSFILVESGLKNADLTPLVDHLRKGFPLPPRIAEMIADAMETKSGSVCSISACRPKAGNPHDDKGNLHNRDVEIGRAYITDLRSAKRGGAKEIRHEIAARFDVSESTVKNAVAYFRRWVCELAG